MPAMHCAPQASKVQAFHSPVHLQLPLRVVQVPSGSAWACTASFGQQVWLGGGLDSRDQQLCSHRPQSLPASGLICGRKHSQAKLHCPPFPSPGIFFLDAPKGQEALTALFGVASIGFMVRWARSALGPAWCAATPARCLPCTCFCQPTTMPGACYLTPCPLALPALQVVSSVINLALPFVSAVFRDSQRDMA